MSPAERSTDLWASTPTEEPSPLPPVFMRPEMKGPIPYLEAWAYPAPVLWPIMRMAYFLADMASFVFMAAILLASVFFDFFTGGSPANWSSETRSIIMVTLTLSYLTRVLTVAALGNYLRTGVPPRHAIKYVSEYALAGLAPTLVCLLIPSLAAISNVTASRTLVGVAAVIYLIWWVPSRVKTRRRLATGGKGPRYAHPSTSLLSGAQESLRIVRYGESWDLPDSLNDRETCTLYARAARAEGLARRVIGQVITALTGAFLIGAFVSYSHAVNENNIWRAAIAPAPLIAFMVGAYIAVSASKYEKLSDEYWGRVAALAKEEVTFSPRNLTSRSKSGALKVQQQRPDC